MRLFCPRHSVFTYPDILVACGALKFLDDRDDTLTDATAIVEGLPVRSEKFDYYRSLSSFAEYLLLAQDTVRAEHHARQVDGSWLFREFASPEYQIELKSIGCRLRLGALYERVEFQPAS